MTKVIEERSVGPFEYPTERDLDSLFRRHSGDPMENGWRVRMRYRFRYHKPGSWYQAVVDRLVTGESHWLEVGGGKTVFPENRDLSRELAERSKLLVGVDPSGNILQNYLVDERHQLMIEDYKTEKRFDLITLHMVAEHIEQPEGVVDALARLAKPDGYVVVYTPNKWAFMSIMARLIPNRFHAFFARLIAPGRKDEDVFPTRFKMNTRKQLRTQFEKVGFREVVFAYLDDCVVMRRFRITYFLELFVWKLLRLLKVGFPENNLLGVYQKQARL